MKRALLRLEASLTDRAGEPPSKVVRDAQEVSLAEFLAESRAATLWGNAAPHPAPGGHLPRPAQGHHRLSGPPGAPGLVVLPPKVSRPGRWKNTPCGGGCRKKAALGFSRLREGELYQWLTREARRLGKNLALAAAQRLVEMVGTTN